MVSQDAARSLFASDSVKVLVVDDHELVAEAMSSYLSTNSGFEAVAVFDIKSALDAIKLKGPFSVILLDDDMPLLEPMESMSKLSTANGGRIAMLSGMANSHAVGRALLAGAIGFVPKTLPLKLLQDAIRLMADGEIFMPSELLRTSAA
ncbi:two-component system, NarL family, nitrate/nitrite response regulator NarP [Pseudorhodobacter antarcticus]|uniref:Two-component system, NarL family, nitrate/nitrite response regulator NarP n=1 Tax=Pseudorhodobacter antarcticus TaxID=1077947 RepID=A0A1H8NYL6_9RHOB|nr:response regulator [Pseudorhodobacter antarcticus]SEO34692.1 two-component system, NarL family, nitrate/nitrite response regulator NarP [Pseudorhodobacter antarcticus]